ncbi:NAD(P)-binding protein [Calocera viscosa TUFC12733]|uniref:NAD(P)-binding protein n=1 Tax=Calocera viscosa (strain TUFC12733) TaxID=1330018 RepID=A0A167I6Y2_CALVF|nr:NAD(P)-binding protein [Calocera viscosa TUFC12733]
MAGSTVYLVSGANRGIGLGLVTSLAARPNVVVFAGARNPTFASDLNDLETKYPGKVHTVKLTSADEADNLAAVAEIKRVAGKLDVVIANAGIAKFFGSILETPSDEMKEHYEVNVVGPTVLFQSAWPPLKASPKPEFVIISSAGGSIAGGASLPAGLLAYGASKAGANFLAMKLHSEHPELIVADIHPGPVETDMGVFAQKQDKVLRDALTYITVSESVAGILNLVDHAKREEAGPKLIGYEGTVFPW